MKSFISTFSVWLYWAIILLAGVWIGWSGGRDSGREDMEQQAISRGFAGYNSTNKVFEWKTNIIYNK